MQQAGILSREEVKREAATVIQFLPFKQLFWRGLPYGILNEYGTSPLPQHRGDSYEVLHSIQMGGVVLKRSLYITMSTGTILTTT